MNRERSDLFDLIDDAIDEERLIATALRLVETKSYPGDEEEVAGVWAELLELAGAETVVDRSIPGSPTVIARAGPSTGRCIQFAGHLDTVPVAHHAPCISNGRLYGRGACDMKAGLAASLEAIQALIPHLPRIGGRLLVTAYGLHEGPGAAPLHAGLRALIGNGHLGDAAIVCEGPRESLPTAGKGALIFRITFSRDSEAPDHELRADPANPMLAALRWIELANEHVRNSSTTHATLGGETLFIGSFSGGELYNTVARTVTIEGTRRFPPPRRFEEVVDELDTLATQVVAEYGVEIDREFRKSGQPFELDAAEPIIAAVRQAHQSVLGVELPLGEQLFSSDLNLLVAEGGIPTAAYGVDPSKGHSTPESVPIDELPSTARIYAHAAATYLLS